VQPYLNRIAQNADHAREAAQALLDERPIVAPNCKFAAGERIEQERHAPFTERPAAA
jgi:hypothetical protein